MAASVQQCKCQSVDCPVVVILHDESSHLASKHMLMNENEYFQTMFHTDMKEKQTNEVKLQEDISQTDLLVFLDAVGHPDRPLPNGDAFLTLIFLADRFLCPSLRDRILAKLTNSSLFSAPAQVKLDLLETADKHRGNSTDILEAVARLCANLPPDVVSSLHGKMTDGTLAAVLFLIAKVAYEHDIPSHWCKVEMCHVRRQYDRVSEDYSRWVCDACHGTAQPISHPVTFEKVNNIQINKNMFG